MRWSGAGVVDSDVAGRGLGDQLAADAPQLDVARGGVDVGAAVDRANGHVAACRVDGGFSGHVVELDVP